LSSTGQAAGVNPENFKIIDGKLYLGWSRKGINKFAANFKSTIPEANAAWTTLQK